MLRWAVTVLLAALAFVSSSAFADDTLGQILAKGAKKLNGNEAVKILTSGTLRGLSPNGAEVALQYRSDGSLTGTIGRGTISDGKWRSDASGKMCADFWLPEFNRGFENLCRFWFKLGELLYVPADSESDSDPDAVVMQRTITPNAK